MATTRPIRKPAADFAAKSLPATTLAKLAALRIHSDSRPAIGFRLLTSHRFSHPDAPEGLMYLGGDLNTCLWECFGDQILEPGAKISRGKWFNSRLSEVESREPVTLCDLTELKTRRRLGVDLSALKHTDLSIPQSWGLALQSHPGKIDGFRFQSRFTNDPCLVFFDRPEIVAKLKSREGKLLPEIAEANEFLMENEIHLV